MRHWFDLISALCLYCLRVYIVCFPTYPFFLEFFLNPYLSIPLRIDPSVSRPDDVKGDWTWLCFFVFIMCCIVHFFRLVNACFYSVRFSIPSREIGLGNVSEMTYVVSSGTQNHNSIRNRRESICTGGFCFDHRTSVVIFNLADVKPFCYGTKYFLFYQAKSYTPFRRTYSLSLAIFWT